MTPYTSRAYERGFQDGDAGREFAPPYVKPENRDWYAHGYYSGEYAYSQRATWAQSSVGIQESRSTARTD